MNRNERFFCTTKLRTPEDFDLILNFKKEISRRGDTMSSENAAKCYAELVSEFFGIESLKEELTKCFYAFHRNDWRCGKNRNYPIGRLVTILGKKRYQRAAKIFKKSEIKQQLEKAEIRRVGLLTFINMVNYVIYTLVYKK